MIRALIAAALLTGTAAARPAEPASLPALRVTPGGHMLETVRGTPFFWLGDTAWELIHRTTRDEISFYLRTRARQGFTVIQTVVLAEFDGIREPTADGLTPFADNDPQRPNSAYFDKVAWVVDEAARNGLYVALLPTWGDKLTAPWGAGPRLFTVEHLEVARAYGKFLAQRLKARTNVVWMLGGDRPAKLQFPGAEPRMSSAAVKAGIAADADWTPVWAAMAAGLAEGGADVQHRLVAFHPQGGEFSTSVQLPDAAWVDLNGMQSGHGGGHDLPVSQWIARDYALPHPKPTLDFEPNYEDHPYNPWPQWDPATGWFRDHDVRKQVYRSVFAGGAGVTYGHHAVWGFVGARYPVVNFADRDWVLALHRPAADEMRYLRDLVLSRPYATRVPAPELIVDNPVAGAQHMVAARGGDGSYAFVYVPSLDQQATIDLSRLPIKHLDAWWYDPRSGKATPIVGVAPGGTRVFKSPPYGPDWVLVLDNADRHFPLPGFAPELP